MWFNAAMDTKTIAQLNAINREFYRVTATSFDETRGQPWPGWVTLLPHLQTPLSVLDVGCGNGRFGLFLAAEMGSDVRYHGIDNNAALLHSAETALQQVTLEQVQLTNLDIVEQGLPDGAYDLVVAFGVLHHIPGREQREQFVQKLAAQVKPGGLLAFATWRFYEFERFRQRIVPWDVAITVEPHDYLLDWRRGEVALRYCHYVDDAEQAALIAASGLSEITTYRADGFSGTVNCYSLLRKIEHTP